MRARFLAGIALTKMSLRSVKPPVPGMTLIELVIVVAIMGILLATAVPSYRTYMLRVHRTEAVRMLLQASMCQERIHANRGNYDTSKCHPASEQQRYRVSYSPTDTQGQNYVATATPQGAQLTDPCGNLSLDQNGGKSISGSVISVLKCWNGR